jgi:hypothetical protein
LTRVRVGVEVRLKKKKNKNKNKFSSPTIDGSCVIAEMESRTDPKVITGKLEVEH